MAVRKVLILSTLIVFVLCLAPVAGRLKFPSLYADDTVRIEQLQTEPVSALLFKPFNEHMAPLFQGVSWLTWQAAGRSLEKAPLAFTLASYLPYLLTLALLFWLIRRETRNLDGLDDWTDALSVGVRPIGPDVNRSPSTWPVALVSLAILGLSSLSIEVVYWYSASSFTWALLLTLLAWSAAAIHCDRSRSWSSLIGLALASAFAPAFSAIGLLAGPAAAIRLATGQGDRRRRMAGIAASAVGVFAYLGICSAFRYHSVVASNLERKANFLPGLLATLHAPMGVLVPSLFGLPAGDGPGPIWGTVLSLLAIGGWVWHALRRATARPLVLGGLFLMLGGYALALCARPDEPGHAAIQTQRYHLFPLLGLVFALTPAWKILFEKPIIGPRSGLAGALAVTAALWLVQHPEIQNRGRFYRHTDQVKTLRVLDRLAVVLQESGVTRSQALGALDPIETEWTPPGHSALIMLAEGAPRAVVADAEVKRLLLAALTADERRSVCGGMDASPYLVAGDAATPLAVGREVARFRMREVVPGRLVSAGYPSFVEYAIEGDAPRDVRALGLDGARAGEWFEVWWRGDAEKWSETRSVRLRPLSADPPTAGWRLPLDRLPHWDAREMTRLRLLYHAKGAVAVEAPRLLR